MKAVLQHKDTASASPKKALRGIAAGAVAVATAAALVFAGMPASFAANAVSIADSNYPAGTTAISDADTTDSYKQFPTGDQTTSYDTTEFAGRLWTDKSVFVPEQDGKLGSSVTLNLADENRNLDPEGVRTQPGELQVEKTAAGTFLTCVSALSSSLTTEITEPVPLDIVMVLDVSGSMAENGTIAYRPYTRDQIDNLGAGDRLSNTYFKSLTGTYVNKAALEGYCWVSENADGSNAVRVPYIDKYQNSAGNGLQSGLNLFIVTDDEDLIGTSKTLYAWFEHPDGHVHTGTDFRQYSFGYTNLYTQYRHFKIDDLRVAAEEFVTSISQNNQKLVDEGYSDDYMSQISLVKFSSQYLNNSDTPNYTVGTANNGYTQIMTPLTVYTDANVGQVQSIAQNLQANGSTYADYGLTLAKGVFDGEALVGGQKQPGARPGVQKVVVFFTDGNPKHTKGSSPHDFAGLFAQQTWDAARVLKNDGVVIYSVAVVDGADADDTTMNANIYLNGVSSNYPNATAIDGVDNNNNNIYGTNVGRNVPADLAEEYYMPSALSWNPTLGDRAEAYAATSDTSLVAGKTYYTRTGKGTTADPYVYTAVGTPIEANLGSYFERINYYLTVGGDQTLSEAFEKIMNQISAGGGEDTTATGRDGNTAITITDYLGDYMEFKGLDGILYGVKADETKFYAPGTQGAYHEQAQVQRDDASVTQSTYTLWPKDRVPSALLNPPSGQEFVSLNGITVKVTRSTDAKTGDTVTITIPPELIPSLRYAVSQQIESGVTSTVVSRVDADPLRIFFSVGPKASTLSDVISRLEEQALRSENATNESDRQSAAYMEFLENAAAEGEDGIYKLYSNKVPELTAMNQGTATVAMSLSEANPYYFWAEDEALYVENGSGEYVPATSSTYTQGDTLYTRHRVWTVGQAADEKKYVEWSGTPSLNSTTGAYYIPAGSPRTTDGDYTNVSLAKADEGGNVTNTATTSLVSTFSGGTTAGQYLGNNGVLSIPVLGTLAVTKNIKAGAGFDLPTDPVPAANFTLHIYDAQGQPLNEADTYRALIRDANGHPVDPATHASVTSAASAKFYIADGGTFELRDGETLKVTNLPDGATYQVVEAGQEGYAATVTNNDNSKQEFGRGAQASTAPASSTP